MAKSQGCGRFTKQHTHKQETTICHQHLGGDMFMKISLGSVMTFMLLNCAVTMWQISILENVVCIYKALISIKVEQVGAQLLPRELCCWGWLQGLVWLLYPVTLTCFACFNSTLHVGINAWLIF